jgi:hypothetical protein
VWEANRLLGTPLAAAGDPLGLLFLALDAAVYPTLLAAVVILLNQPRRVPLLSAFLATGMIVSIGVGLGLVFAFEGAFTKDNHTLSPTVDLTVGGLVLLLAVALATRADARYAERRRRRSQSPQSAPAEQEKGEPVMQRLLARQSTPLVVLASLALNLPGASYLVGLKDIAAAHHPAVGTVLLVVGFNVVMFALAELPLAGLIVNPDATEGAVTEVNRWFTANGRRIAIVVCLALSGFLIVRGIAHV